MYTSVNDLPDLSQHYQIPEEHAARYQRDGHILLRCVASSQDVAAYRPHIAEAAAAFGQQPKPLDQRDSYHKAFLQIANLWENDLAVRRFTFARRFARIAAELMGVDGVRLWHDQALFKEPGGGPTPWHQDQYYWPLDTANTITMWMPLVDIPEQAGALTFASGSHRQGGLASMAISDESEDFFGSLVEERGYEVTRSAMAAGDATFHSGWTLHTAPGNSTDRMREVMTVIYFEDGARILEPQNPHHPADLARWLPGLAPGQEAASPLNPLLYHK